MSSYVRVYATEQKILSDIFLFPKLLENDTPSDSWVKPPSNYKTLAKSSVSRGKCSINL